METTEKVLVRKSRKPFPVNLEEVKKPFRNQLAVAKVFCTGCGVIHEIDLERAKQIAGDSDKEYQTIYFVSDHCNITCHDGEKMIQYQIEKIPS